MLLWVSGPLNMRTLLLRCSNMSIENINSGIQVWTLYHYKNGKWKEEELEDTNNTLNCGEASDIQKLLL